MPNTKFRRETVWPFLLAGTITVCSGFPAALPEMGWFEPDKLGHFVAYGALGTAIVRHPALSRWQTIGAAGAILLASAYGLGDEFRQSLTIFRLFEWDDWLADAIGAFTAVVLYVRWTGYRRLLEKPIRFNRPKPAEQQQEILATEGSKVTKTEEI
jgi:VanZ family protein